MLWRRNQKIPRPPRHCSEQGIKKGRISSYSFLFCLHPKYCLSNEKYTHGKRKFFHPPGLHPIHVCDDLYDPVPAQEAYIQQGLVGFDGAPVAVCVSFVIIAAAPVDLSDGFGSLALGDGVALGDAGDPLFL